MKTVRLLLLAVALAALGGEYSRAEAQQFVSGTLLGSTTWYDEIVVVGNVVVPSGLTLTIEAGTNVRFVGGTSLRVEGTLDVRGTAARPVTFGRFIPSDAWEGMRINSVGRISFATISGASTAITYNGASLDISQSSFIGNGTALQAEIGASAPATIVGSTFEDNTYAVAGREADLRQCVFRGNAYGLFSTDLVTVTEGTFEGNTVAMRVHSGSVERTLVRGNATGIDATGAAVFLRRNTITGNGTGLVVPGALAALEFNGIFGNTTFDAEVRGPGNVTAANNWWGSTVPAVIDSKIRDNRDDTTLGLLTYSPLLAAPHPDAPPVPAPPSTCDVTLTRPGTGLTMGFSLSTPEPATWSVWMSVHASVFPVWSVPLPVLAAPTPVSVPIPVFPAVGGVGVLTTLSTPSRGIACSAWGVVDTGAPSSTATPLSAETLRVLIR